MRRKSIDEQLVEMEREDREKRVLNLAPKMIEVGEIEKIVLPDLSPGIRFSTTVDVWSLAYDGHPNPNQYREEICDLIGASIADQLKERTK